MEECYFQHCGRAEACALVFQPSKPLHSPKPYFHLPSFIQTLPQCLQALAAAVLNVAVAFGLGSVDAVKMGWSR